MKRLACLVILLTGCSSMPVEHQAPKPKAAEAEGSCLTDPVTTHDYSQYPPYAPAVPSTPRMMAVEIAEWGGEHIRYYNTGNGIEARSLGSKKVIGEVVVDVREVAGLVDITAVESAGQRFCGTPPGDYDLVMFSESMCDGCRYGVGHAWRCPDGLVIWENLTVPMARVGRYDGSSEKGVFTFAHGADQYLIGNDLSIQQRDCRFKPALYIINSVNDIEQIGCVPYSFRISGGVHVGDVLYLSADSTFHVRMFQISGSGASLSLVELQRPLNLSAKPSYFGHAIRADDDILIAANATNGVLLWDVTDPASPQLVGQLDQRAGRVSVRGDLAMIAEYAGSQAWAVDISRPADPIDITGDFFDPGNTWNDYPYIAWRDIEIDPSGQTAYGARYSVAQQYDCSGCPPPLFYAGFETGDTSEWSK